MGLNRLVMLLAATALTLLVIGMGVWVLDLLTESGVSAETLAPIELGSAPSPETLGPEVVPQAVTGGGGRTTDDADPSESSSSGVDDDREDDGRPAVDPPSTHMAADGGDEVEVEVEEPWERITVNSPPRDREYEPSGETESVPEDEDDPDYGSEPDHQSESESESRPESDSRPERDSGAIDRAGQAPVVESDQAPADPSGDEPDHSSDDPSADEDEDGRQADAESD